MENESKAGIGMVEEDLSRYNPEGSDLRRIQMKMLEMLVVLDEICNRYKIPYWLSAGTLIGANKYRGFIPWDDDLDVQVLRKDFNRLMEILEKELPGDLKIQTRKTDRHYRYGWAKIRDTKSYIVEPDTAKYDYKYNGIFLDIFPVEPFLNIWLKQKMDALRIRFEVRKHVESKLEKCFNYSLGMFYPLPFLYTSFVRFVYKFKKTRYYTFGPTITAYDIYPVENIFPLSKIDFEGGLFNAPGQVHKFLFNAYACDCMGVPPEEGRKQHISDVVFYGYNDSGNKE